MLQKNKNNSTEQFNFTFVNPGFSDFPEILMSQNEGKKIRLVFERDLFRNDFFQPTALFPFHFTEVPRKYYEWKILQKTIHLAPHLFLSHKVFYSGSHIFLKNKAHFADFLYKNHYQQKVQFFSPTQKNNFWFLHQNAQKGLFFHEFKVNISRLFIEILQQIQSSGGEIYMQKNVLFSASSKISENVKYCKPESTPVFGISTETYPGFFMQVLYQTNRVCFYEKNKTLEIQYIQNGHKTFDEKETKLNLEKYFLIKHPDLTVEHIPLKLSVKVLKEIVSQLKYPLPGAFKDAKFENMFELCRVKFDVAKQTGIDFPEFKILFHRYGKNIDEMTEKAYETMAVTRDPLKIWALTEKWIKKEKEWKN